MKKREHNADVLKQNTYMCIKKSQNFVDMGCLLHRLIHAKLIIVSNFFVTQACSQ